MHPGVHRIREGKSRQVKHGFGRERYATVRLYRTVQASDGVNMMHVPYRGSAAALTNGCLILIRYRAGKIVRGTEWDTFLYL